MIAVATGAKRGRPAAATQGDVLRVAAEQYLAGQRVDLTIIASELGLSRATIYRWFGSREALLGAVIARELEQLIERRRREVRRHGAAALLEVFDRINRSLSRSTALRRLLEQERDSAMRLLTSSGGVVQPTAVTAVERLIADEVAAGFYEPPAAPRTLAYAIVRLAEAFIYNDAAIGIRGDHDALREVQAALLGIGTPRRLRAARAQAT
jgi:AcrR family transcriptional regulator